MFINTIEKMILKLIDYHIKTIMTITLAMPLIDSINEFTINFILGLCEINLRGLRILSNLTI